MKGLRTRRGFRLAKVKNNSHSLFKKVFKVKYISAMLGVSVKKCGKENGKFCNRHIRYNAFKFLYNFRVAIVR